MTTAHQNCVCLRTYELSWLVAKSRSQSVGSGRLSHSLWINTTWSTKSGKWIFLRCCKNL